MENSNQLAMRWFACLISFLLLPNYLLGQSAIIKNAKIANAALPSYIITTNFADEVFQNFVQATAGAGKSAAITINQGSSNSLRFLAVVNTKASAPDPTSIVATNGVWGLVSSTNNLGGTITNQISLFTNSTSTAYAETLIATNVANNSQTGWELIYWEGNGASNIVQIVLTNGTTANPSCTWATSTAYLTNARFFVWSDSVNSTGGRTPNTNWTVFVQQSQGSPNDGSCLVGNANILSGQDTITNTATARTWQGIGIEVGPALEADPTTRPTFIQGVTFYTTGEIGKWFTNALPNLSLPGNLINVHVIMTNTYSIAITDDKGSVYTRAHTSNEGTDLTFEDWYTTNCAANIKKLFFVPSGTVGDGSNSLQFHVEMTEWARIALYNPLDGNADNAGPVNGSNILTGAAVNVKDGDLVIAHYTDVSSGQLQSGVLQTANSTGGRLLWAQTRLANGCNSFTAVKGGAINALCNFGTPAADAWNASIVCYKRGSGGTIPPPNQTRILRLVFDDCANGGGNFVNLASFEGNLAVFSSTLYKAAGHVTNIVANTGSPWKEIVTTSVNAPQMWYASNQTACINPPAVLTIGHDKLGGELVAFWDIINASPYPFDLETEGTYGDPLTFLPNTWVTNNASITPSASGGIIINVAQYYAGPESYSTNANAFYDTPGYVYATDSSHYNNGDAVQHIFPTDTSTVNFAQFLINHSGAGSGTVSTAVRFKPLGQ